MTIKLQLETLYQTLINETDELSTQKNRILHSLLTQIEAEELAAKVDDLPEVKVARILESNKKNLESLISNGLTIYQPRVDLIDEVIIPKLTNEELSTLIQNKFNESPEITTSEMSIYLNDYFYDLESFIPTYYSLKP